MSFSLLATLTGLVQSFGYVGIFVLMTLESALIPIPSEITMPFGGVLASRGILQLWFVVLAGTIGNVAGSLIGYYIGFFLEETVLLKWIRSYGKFLLVREKDYHTAARWFTHYGNRAVFFSRLLPAVRTYISLAAGAFRMPLKPFVAYTFAGSFLWCASLSVAGYYLGTQWINIGPIFNRLQYGVIFCVLIGLGYFVYYKLRHRR
ncbi:MAG: DedA family protein [Minisyncoccia bacterium]